MFVSCDLEINFLRIIYVTLKPRGLNHAEERSPLQFTVYIHWLRTNLGINQTTNRCPEHKYGALKNTTDESISAQYENLWELVQARRRVILVFSPPRFIVNLKIEFLNRNFQLSLVIFRNYTGFAEKAAEVLQASDLIMYIRVDTYIIHTLSLFSFEKKYEKYTQHNSVESELNRTGIAKNYRTTLTARITKI